MALYLCETFTQWLPHFLRDSLIKDHSSPVSDFLISWNRFFTSSLPSKQYLTSVPPAHLKSFRNTKQMLRKRFYIHEYCGISGFFFVLLYWIKFSWLNHHQMDYSFSKLCSKVTNSRALKKIKWKDIFTGSNKSIIPIPFIFEIIIHSWKP